MVGAFGLRSTESSVSAADFPYSDRITSPESVDQVFSFSHQMLQPTDVKWSTCSYTSHSVTTRSGR